MVLILTSSSAIGVFCLYRSPWILQPNWQITYADISGSHWASHYAAESKMAFSEMGWIQAYVQTEMPDHFGYHEHEILGESLKQDTIILLGKRFKLASDDPVLSKKGMICPSIMARQGFNKEDFEKLNEDRSVNRLYYNGEFEILLVKSSGTGAK